MQRHCFALVFALLAAPAFAQNTASAPSATEAPAQARQFDFLLGEWQLDVHPKVSGLVAMIHGAPKLVGTWKAWAAKDGDGVEDELRIVDASGNPMTLNRSRRSWSASQARWKVSADDAYHARHSESTAQLQNGEMRVDGRYVDADGKTVLTRTRYFDIGAAAFRMQQDRSTDDGQTWDEAVLTIDAKRTAATAASP